MQAALIDKSTSDVHWCRWRRQQVRSVAGGTFFAAFFSFVTVERSGRFFQRAGNARLLFLRALAFGCSFALLPFKALRLTGSFIVSAMTGARSFLLKQP